jgi:hypothetical protein
MNILVGNTLQDLASQILHVYNDREFWKKLSQNGLCFFRDNYSLESVGTEFEQLMTSANAVASKRTTRSQRFYSFEFRTNPIADARYQHGRRRTRVAGILFRNAI